METTITNEIIAEFMGLQDLVKANGKLYMGVFDDPKEDEIQYHSSWDWLMPVVEKIESLGEEIGDTDSEINYHFFICKRYTRVIYNWNAYSVIMQGTPTITKEDFINFKNSCKDYKHLLFDGNKLISTYTAVVEFIKWHNNLTTSQTGE